MNIHFYITYICNSKNKYFTSHKFILIYIKLNKKSNYYVIYILLKYNY